MKNVFIILRMCLFVCFFGLAKPITAITFIHPGGIHTIADIDRMKAKVKDKMHPWIDGYNAMISDALAQKTYTAAPYTNIGGTGNRQRASKDAHAAYYNTLRWYITGDTTYAECAVKIINAWSYKLTEASGELFQLPINNFVQAAEILRLYPHWKTADINQFKSVALNIFYPACHATLPTCHLPTSWEAPALSSIMAIAVFCDDQAKYDEAVAYYKNGTGNGALEVAIPFETGQVLEMGRDMVHANIGLSNLAEMCQTAWNQGDTTLYSYANNRLLAGYEYFCKYNLNHAVDWVAVNPCDGDNFLGISYYNNRGRITNNPTFEMAYNHFAVLKGLAPAYTKYTKAMAELSRPEGGNADFFGYGTLTFTLDAAASPAVPFSTVPPVPTNLTATSAVGKVYLQWTASEEDLANGYNIQRATSATGPYTSISSDYTNTLTTYTDASVTDGTTYYYKIASHNQKGLSSYSAVASATPVAAASLPTGWAVKDLGRSTATGSATYSPVVGNTFVVNGTGSSMTGSSDNYTYAYAALSGDFSVTVHMADYTWSWNNDKGGIAVRESLDPSAKAFTLYQGETGLRFTMLQTRKLYGESTSSFNGNKFGFTPWYRITRRGKAFYAYQSTDGINYGLIDSSYIYMTNSCYVGFAVCSGATGSFANVTYENLTLTGGGSVPLAPKTFTASAINSSRVKLTWVTSTTTSAYNLKRATSIAGPYTTIAKGLTTVNYVDSNLVAGTTYYYALRSANAIGESADSVQVTQQTSPLSLPPAPKGLTVEAGNASVALTWNATDEAPDSYKVMRATTALGTYTLIGTSATTSYTDQTAVNGSTYYYTVTAVNTVGDGTPSAAVGVTLSLKLTGTLIGTAGSWDNVSTVMKSAAVDENLSTFFDASIGDGAWVGYDLGTNKGLVSVVKYAPRSNYSARMVGGIFQGASQSDFSDAVTLFTVAESPTAGILTSQTVTTASSYRYLRYLSPASGFCNVAEVEFWGQLLSTSALTTISSDPQKISILYPNPVKDILHITLTEEFSSEAVLQIYNIQGILLLSQAISANEISIDVRNLHSGSYIIKISNKKNQVAEKFVKIN